MMELKWYGHLAAVCCSYEAVDAMVGHTSTTDGDTNVHTRVTGSRDSQPPQLTNRVASRCVGIDVGRELG